MDPPVWELFFKKNSFFTASFTLSKTTQAVSKRDLIMGLRAPVKVKKLSAKEKQDEKVLLGHLYEDKVFLR